ncbi:unnamed protein product [Spirodela intermedia]|uniref:AAA+ ATPase domain-containing protein n=1 Tax=Spirodela intermedia TaxID=51605 RepID=A0A7I8JIZ1_SPIIN|nr:unnamed protein product [Spirodela intermedia]CAA6670080.1 unnamed protein product [Spirodela intermedia]
MAHFSVPSSCGTMGTRIYCLSKPAASCAEVRLRVRVEKFARLGSKCGYLSASLLLCPLISDGHRSKTRPISSCNRNIVSNLSRSSEERRTRVRLESRANSRRRRPFSLRLRPRFRLLFSRLRRLPFRASVEQVRQFMHRNFRIVVLVTSISVALGLCALIVPYSDLVTDLQGGYVSKVLFEEGSRRIFYNKHSVVPHDPTSVPSEPGIQCDDTLETSGRTLGPAWQFSTRKIDHDENFLLSLMREKGAVYSSAPQSALMAMRGLVITILTLWIPLTPLMWLLYRQISAANSPAKKRRPTTQMVDFDDVEGVDAAKAELMEVDSFMLTRIHQLQQAGSKATRGVLLSGPPGTGKTLLARAVAGEAGVPFFSVSASEFVELPVQGGRKYSPSIIFIDELDAVGGRRGRSFNDERDQTLNQLLTEMDGFESDMKVIVIGATNRPDALDPALCRPGRFSRKVVVGEPDYEGRRKIWEDSQLVCNLIASLTPGLVGADLANIVNEAALLTARRGGEVVTRDDIMAAVERAKFGINERRLTPETISKGLEKLFPWIPSLIKENEFLGYQTLS